MSKDHKNFMIAVVAGAVMIWSLYSIGMDWLSCNGVMVRNIYGGYTCVETK